MNLLWHTRLKLQTADNCHLRVRESEFKHIGAGQILLTSSLSKFSYFPSKSSNFFSHFEVLAFLDLNNYQQINGFPNHLF